MCSLWPFLSCLLILRAASASQVYRKDQWLMYVKPSANNDVLSICQVAGDDEDAASAAWGSVSYDT
jgi:hypothetical protein